ncbi:TetR/AcrR family transcriptional regulator [Halobacillus salinus]|uniref:TetR/AcrR family transcriptional regulator n=1 Tax=Halobacillus salinus TaxID=192814 RepID=UPI0009A901C5|nr:TetR/AcrR family transcriptional regulator [Halobacillus salinus]
MNGFERRKERKKQNILQAALQLFSEYGVQKVSIQEIAQQAEVSQVTIYNYFGSKDQLLYHTVEMLVRDRIEQSSSIIDDDSMSFQEKIKLIITNKKQDLLKFNSEFLQSVVSDQPDIQKFISTITEKESVPMLMRLVKQGKAEGSIHPDLSFETIMFFVEMYYKAFEAMPENNQQSLSLLGEELLHIFFYGIMGGMDEQIHEQNNNPLRK